MTTTTRRTHSEQASDQCHDPYHLPLHLLPPEVQLNLLEYLELYELQSFSETSYHCNTTVASFLKQQLDMACRTATTYLPLRDATSIYRLKGTNFIHRVARLDTTAAARLVLLDERSEDHPRNSKNSSRSHNTNYTSATHSSFLDRFHHNNNNNNNTNATAGALRQLLSDGLAAVHEQQRRTAQQLWSHAGAGTVLVLAMAGRLFYQTWHERLRPLHSSASNSTTCWYEWHDLSRLAVGLLFAGTVFVGVSKQQQKRRKALRLAAKLQANDSNSSNRPESSLPHQHNMKRSRSVAGNLAAAAAILPSAPRGPLQSRCSVPVSSSAVSTSSLHLSVSMPNLHHMLLHHPESSDQAMEEQIQGSTTSSSCHDAKAPEEGAHGTLQESLWNVTEDELPAKRKDPLWQQQQQQRRHHVKPLSLSGGNVASSLNSCLLNNKQKTSERTPFEAAATRTPAHGCVGAYQRAVADAKIQIVDILKSQRTQAFAALPSDRERADLSTALIDSCTDDASLDAVRIMARRLPLDTFYVGSDNTESCALHTAAFHGACQVLDFLCRGIDGSSSSWSSSTKCQNEHCYDDDDDGGLCNVNARDANGWTALHFAAGANCPEAVAVLARQGASLNTEARNGYTPLQWALRLQNKQVAEELKRWLAEEKKQSQNKFWGLWRQRWNRLVGAAVSTRGRAY